MKLLKRFEGGAVYTDEKDGNFLVIVNQVALLDMLDEEDREGIEAMEEIAFVSDTARLEFLKERGWQ
jgi:hypothetical protein